MMACAMYYIVAIRAKGKTCGSMIPYKLRDCCGAFGSVWEDFMSKFKQRSIKP